MSETREPMAAPIFDEDMNLADHFLFARVREGFGGKVAIRWGARSYDYDEVAERSRCVAQALVAIGVRPGERVYIVLPDSPPFAWAFFGALAAGAVVAMGNADAAPADLAAVVEYVRPAVIVTIPRVAEGLARAAAAQGAPGPRAILVAPEAATGDDPTDDRAFAGQPGEVAGIAVRSLEAVITAARAAPAAVLPRPQRDDPAIWLFTSGSTGRPKAAMHAHRDFAFNAEVYARRTLGLRSDDVTLSVPRLFFGYATGTNLMFPFSVGATVCLFAERPTPEALAGWIERYAPTVVTNVPTTLAKLLEHDEALRRASGAGLSLSSVRFHLSAGEALPEALYRRFTERFGGEIFDGIGSAEMFHIYATNRPGDVMPGSLGRAVEGYTLRVLAEDAEGAGAPEVPRGEIGVLWVRGDSVAMGYHRDRDKSFRTFHGHWCRTGDLFCIDERGYLYFAGRADDLLKVSGQWLAPSEVEGALTAHPAVAEAAVIGAVEVAEGREGLVKPKAYVVLREAARRGLESEAGRAALTEALQAHVRGALAFHKCPRWIVFVDDLPRGDRGKVDRKALRALDAASAATGDGKPGAP